MKKLLVLAMVLLSSISYGQEFMGIKVDGKKDAAIVAFKSKGFILKDDSDGSVVMNGRIGSDVVELFITYSPITKTVWGYRVFLPKQSTWSYIKSDYEKYLGILTEKYGSPEKSYNFFSSPYDEGDGYEMTAVAVDKCTYAAFWTKEQGVRIKISKYKQVQISYENAKNSELDDAETKSINTKVF